MSKLMIVDDNAEIREIIRSAVSSDSDVVVECSDGAEAVEAFPGFRPDYVIMDIQMKTMDGITATARIRKQDPAAKVIIVTQHVTPSFRAAAEKAGASGFIAKENLLELNRLIHPEKLEL